MEGELFSPAVVDLYTCLINKHWHLLVLTITTVLTFPLTIVSSGHFVPERFETTSALTLQVQDAVRYFSDGIPGGTGAMDRVFLTGKLSVAKIDSGLSAQSWTYGDFVLPQL